MTERKKRNGTIDFVKLLAASIIFLGHINEIGWNNIGNAMSTLTMVVELFFIISGFFLMMHLDHLPEDSNENTLIFAVNKIKGFFAPLCIVNFVHFFYFCMANNVNTISNVAAKLWHFKGEFLLLQCAGMIQNPQFNEDFLLGHTWYLSAMMITLILLYPLARYFRRAFVNIICPMSIIFVYAAFINKYGNVNVGAENLFFIPDSLPRAFAGQCCGVLCYSAYKVIKTRELYKTAGYKAADMVSWLMIPLMIALGFSGIHDAPVFFMFPLCIIVISSMLGESPISCRLARIPSRVTDVMGKISLYIYITHFTILLLVYTCMPSLNQWIKVWLSILLTLVYSVLLYLFDQKRHGIKWVCIICLLAVAASFAQAGFR